jgi:hypothetical protein
MERTKGNTPLFGQVSYLSPIHLAGAAAVVAYPLMEELMEELTGALMEVLMEELTGVLIEELMAA